MEEPQSQYTIYLFPTKRGTVGVGVNVGPDRVKTEYLDPSIRTIKDYLNSFNGGIRDVKIANKLPKNIRGIDISQFLS